MKPRPFNISLFQYKMKSKKKWREIHTKRTQHHLILNNLLRKSINYEFEEKEIKIYFTEFLLNCSLCVLFLIKFILATSFKVDEEIGWILKKNVFESSHKIVNAI